MGQSFTWTGVVQSGISTFLHAPIVAPDSDELKSFGATHAIYGIPFDSTTINRPGASFGPRAIRSASAQYLPYHFDFDLDISDYITLVDCGDAHVVPGSAKRTFEAAEADISEIFKAGVMPIVLGGEHSIPIPAARAMAKAMDGPLGFVLVDSHMDTATDLGGEELTHCAPVTRALDEEQFSAANTVLVGIHSPTNPREEREWVRNHGVHMFTSDDIRREGITEITKEAMRLAWNGANGVYVTFDLDVLDAAYCPGTCSPEPGGLTSRELLDAVRIIGEAGYTAFDVCEIAPQYDPGTITALMASRLILDMLASYQAARLQ